MDRTEFISEMESRANFEITEGDLDGTDGVYVKNTMYETETHFSNDAIKINDIGTLVAHTSHGRNVENITRVTGFFSKTSAWNKGKQGELKDRARTEIK